MIRTRDAVTVDVGARRVAATTIRIARYRHDPAHPRYEQFADTTYIFTLADAVPGKVVELRSELMGPANAAGDKPATAIAETLRYVGER